MEASEIAAAIGVELVAKLTHGAGYGAYEVRMPDGRTAALKLSDHLPAELARIDAMVDALRARGYPAPATYATGDMGTVRYQLLELMPGAAVGQVMTAHLERIAELNEMQRALGLPGREPWTEHIVASVVDGRADYCQTAPLRAANPELLDRLQSIGRASAGISVASDDAVHYDFSPLNLLGTATTITGVIDFQGLTAGDAAFDLVSLAFYTHDLTTRDTLLGLARRRTNPDVLPLYAAHMVLRQVDWSLRNHDASVAWFTGLGESLLAAVGAPDRPERL